MTAPGTLRWSGGSAWALLLVGVMAALFHLAGLWGELPLLRLVTKPLPVLCLALWVLHRERDRYASLVTSGLALSLVGDVLLEVAGHFLAGLVAFLMAHLCYVGAFCSDQRRPALLPALPFAAWGLLVYAELMPHLGQLRVPVAIYVIAIFAMMWRSAARVGSARVAGLSAWLGLAGAVLFGVSDTLIAFDRFQAPIPGARYAIILLYWAGQAGIASSVASRRVAT
jgi:uncharacterized membrane protein YhhN